MVIVVVGVEDVRERPTAALELLPVRASLRGIDGGGVACGLIVDEISVVVREAWDLGHRQAERGIGRGRRRRRHGAGGRCEAEGAEVDEGRGGEGATGG